MSKAAEWHEQQAELGWGRAEKIHTATANLIRACEKAVKYNFHPNYQTSIERELKALQEASDE